MADSRSWLRRLARPTLALLLGFALLEVGARALLLVLPAPIELGWQRGEGPGAKTRDLLYVPDPELFFRLAPDLDIPSTSNPRIFDLKTNSLGLRGGELSRPKPADRVRVLAVGDSCTFGSGAGQRDTYPAQLAAALAPHLSGASAEVLNAGVPGFTSYQALRYLEIEGFDLEPDAVVFASGVNDASPARAGGKRRFGADRLLSDDEYAAAIAARRLGLTRLLWRAGFRLGGPRGAAPDATGVKRRVPLARYAANLNRFAEETRARGAVPVVVIWPLQTQLLEPPVDSELERVMAAYQRTAAEAAATSGAVFVDLTPTLAGHTDLYVDIVHLAPEGYRRVAERLATALGPVLAARRAAGESRFP